MPSHVLGDRNVALSYHHVSAYKTAMMGFTHPLHSILLTDSTMNGIMYVYRILDTMIRYSNSCR